MAGRDGRKGSRTTRPLPDPSPPCTLKLLMIGNLHTGKSSLVRNYCSSDIQRHFAPLLSYETHSIGLLDCLDKTLEISGQYFSVLLLVMRTQLCSETFSTITFQLLQRSRWGVSHILDSGQHKF